MSRIFAVNHDRQEVMKIGHTTWDKAPDAPILDRIKHFAPFVERGRVRFYDRANEFQVQELIEEEKVDDLGYKRVHSYWHTPVE